MDRTPGTKKDLSLVLKVCREFDDVTSAVRAAATGNARSPTVDNRVGGTLKSRMTVSVDDQESWRLAEERQPGRLVQVHGCTLSALFCFKAVKGSYYIGLIVPLALLSSVTLVFILLLFVLL